MESRRHWSTAVHACAGLTDALLALVEEEDVSTSICDVDVGPWSSGCGTVT